MDGMIELTALKEPDMLSLQINHADSQERRMQYAGRTGIGLEAFSEETARLAGKLYGASEGVVAEVRRSQMLSNLVSLMNDGTITETDLDGFSDELVEAVKHFVAAEWED